MTAEELLATATTRFLDAKTEAQRVFNMHSGELDLGPREHVLVADALREAMTCYTELEALKAVLL